MTHVSFVVNMEVGPSAWLLQPESDIYIYIYVCGKNVIKANTENILQGSQNHLSRTCGILLCAVKIRFSEGGSVRAEY